MGRPAVGDAVRPGDELRLSPITVKAALSKVPGVLAVKSDVAERQTTVAFDDAKTDLAALSRATVAVGYPASPVKDAK